MKQAEGTTAPPSSGRGRATAPTANATHSVGGSLPALLSQGKAAASRISVRQALRTLGVLHVFAVGWLVAGGGLFIDDIRAQAYAAGRPIWPFVVESNRTHLAPGARTVDWFMSTMAPLQHWPAVVLTLVIAGLYAAITIRIVRQVVRNPTAQLIGVWWILFGASVIPTYAWFRQALTGMLTIALVMAALSLTIDHVRTGRRQLIIGAVVLHALALTFSERALAIPVAVLAILICHRMFGHARSWRRWLGVLRHLAPHVAINLGFLYAYLGGEFDKGEGAQPSLGDAVAKIGRWFFVDLLPSFLGGPLTWRSGIPPYSFANTPVGLVVLTWLVAFGALFVVWRRRSSLGPAWPAIVAAIAYSVPVLVLVYFGRLAQVRDVTAIDDLRLLPDVGVAVALAIAATIGAVLDGRRAQTRPRSARWHQRRKAGLVVGATLVVLATAVSWIGFGIQWHRSPVTPYLANLNESLVGSKAQVLPTALPPAVVPAWVDPELTTEPLIRLLNPGALQSQMSASPQVVLGSGKLGRARFSVVRAATIPAGFCGQGLPAGVRTTRLMLPSDAPYYRGSVVSVGLLVGDAVRLNLTVVDNAGHTHGPLVEAPPELLRGPHRIQALVPHGVIVRAIDVQAVTPNTDGVCVTSAQVATVGGRS